MLNICIILQSCHKNIEPLNIQIPNGINAVTDQQKQFIENLKYLDRGMSTSDVKKHLGSPEEESSDVLFYNLHENPLFGGFYVTAHLKFDKKGLSVVEIGHGHERLVPVREF
jgi:hypothetical protein